MKTYIIASIFIPLILSFTPNIRTFILNNTDRIVSYLKEYLLKNIISTTPLTLSDENKVKYQEEIKQMIRHAVNAVELLYPDSGMGDKKKELIIVMLKNFHIPTTLATQIPDLIDDVVTEIKKDTK
jgi:hypothetical protein